MTIRTILNEGFAPAIEAMRDPMSSWEKSDSKYENGIFVIGEKDKELSLKLQKAGPEHCKHLRQIFVWAEIIAQRDWYIQLATYRYGVENISTSTMHTLMRRPLEPSDFEHDCMNDEYLKYMLDSINGSMLAYKLEKDEARKKEIWRGIIEALPQSFLQKRHYCFSYAALRNTIHQREGHKLKEWHQFIEWCRTLREPWMLFE